MFSVNTDISIHPLSTLFDSVTSNYVNAERRINDLYAISAVDGVDYTTFNFSNSIKNIIIDSSYTLMLTEYSQLSSFISTNYNLSSYEYGRNDNQFVCNYSSLSALNPITEEDITNQYIVVLDDNLNILPLKTFDDVGFGRYNSFKTYQRIYKKNKPFIQYKITSLPKSVEPDTTNIIYNSYNVDTVAVSATSFIQQGAIGGSCPLNSDMIQFDSSEYGLYSDIGDNNVHTLQNGTLLGLWLSSQTYETSSNKIWMERWFDPNTSDRNFAPYLHTLSSDLNYIVDIPSTKILSPKEKFEYIRHGPIRNDNYISTIEGSVLNLTSWDSSFSQQETSGYLTSFDGDSSQFNMNGTSYGIVIPNNSILPKNTLSFSTWLNVPFLQDYQIFGNFYNDYGYSIGINLGNSTDNVTIPSASGNCFSMNYKGFKVFEKDILNDLALSSINITYINTDLNGNAWLCDSFNKKLYRLENDNIISYQVVLPVDSSISKIRNFSDNSFAILNTNGNVISSFDSTGIFLSSFSISPYATTFDINSYDVISSTSAEFLLFDNYDREIKIIGATVYVDNSKILHLVDKPSSIAVDKDNNIWLLVGKNLLKIDIYGNILFDTILSLGFTTYSSTEMSFVANESGGFNLWIVFNDASRIIVLNEIGSIVKQIPLNNIGNFICTSYTFNIHGNFSNFDSIRKFNKIDNTVISKNNPALTLKLALKCGNNSYVHNLHSKFPPIDKWNHIAFSLGYSENTTVLRMYINGVLSARKVLNGVYTIQYNTPSSPFIIGDYTGKLGPRSLEKTMAKKPLLVGQLSNLNVYNTCLTHFDIQALSRQKYIKWDGIFINNSIPPMTIIEDIDKVNINRYKGYKSNKFNIIVKNFSSDINMQEYIKTYIENNIQKMIPANTSLNSIIFE